MSGLGGGLVGGMLGSMLFRGSGYSYGGSDWGDRGHGMGMMFDFLFLAIIVAVIYFVIKRFRMRRQEMAYNSTSSYGTVRYDMPSDYYTPPPPIQSTIYGGLKHISEMDQSFDEIRFKNTAEDYFFKIQSAWARRDLNPVKYLLTPKMLNTLQEDISRYIANKQTNHLENIAVRQIEIVDAVQDQGEEYITVKFLASILDYTTDDTTDQVISGSTIDPIKFLEYWTWSRRVGEIDWILAGITQEQDY
ncbi:MAG: Tim44 domain-containing protein [Syntrophobacterales bacterium]|nr:Tim44 domain-containing protein [Syntrophobacterales bacterium]